MLARVCVCVQLKVLLQRLVSVEGQLAQMLTRVYERRAQATVNECAAAVEVCGVVFVKLHRSVRARNGHERLAMPGAVGALLVPIVMVWKRRTTAAMVDLGVWSLRPSRSPPPPPRTSHASGGACVRAHDLAPAFVVSYRVPVSEIVELEDAVKNAEGYVALAAEEVRKSGGGTEAPAAARPTLPVAVERSSVDRSGPLSPTRGLGMATPTLWDDTALRAAVRTLLGDVGSLRRSAAKVRDAGGGGRGEGRGASRRRAWCCAPPAVQVALWGPAASNLACSLQQRVACGCSPPQGL
jgi:hypothetical protein